MADPKIEIAIWAGVPLLMLIVFSVVLDSGKELQKKNRELKALAKQYHTYYLDKEADVPFTDALDKANEDLEVQVEEYERITARMMPALPTQYTTTNYTKASARATEDLEAIRKLAERSGVPLPASLPNSDALSVDPIVFSQQLVNLYLFRHATQMMIKDASSGKLSILALKLGKKFCDKSGEVAVFQIDYALQVDFRSLERILRTFNNNKFGLAIRSFDMEVPDRSRATDSVPYMLVNMSVSLCTANKADWGLAELGEAKVSNGESGGRRSRGGRF